MKINKTKMIKQLFKEDYFNNLPYDAKVYLIHLILESTNLEVLNTKYSVIMTGVSEYSRKLVESQFVEFPDRSEDPCQKIKLKLDKRVINA